MQTNTRETSEIIFDNRDNAARRLMSTETRHNNRNYSNNNNDNDQNKTKNEMVTMLVTCEG